MDMFFYRILSQKFQKSLKFSVKIFLLKWLSNAHWYFVLNKLNIANFY